MSQHASHQQHRDAAAGQGPIAIAVVTVSDSRSPETDESGRYLREAIEQAGHRLADYRIIPDESAALIETLETLCQGPVRALLFNGGTGISRRDRTYDSLAGRLEQTLPGFGELFRMLSWDQVGAAAMLSRAVAGSYRGRLIVAMPGSPKAVQLAWEKLLAPEIEHLVWELQR